MEIIEEIGRWLLVVRTYSYEAFLDLVLGDISELLGASRVSLLRFDEKKQQWMLIASTGIMKMSGTYCFSDVPTDGLEDNMWLFSPTNGFGNDAVYIFRVQHGNKPYFCALGIDDTENARNYELQEGSLQKIGNVLREAVLLKLRIMHSESKMADTRVYEDYLTKLPNRRKWEEEMRVLETPRKDLNFAVVDIDHFKRVNDTYGHGIGDEVLKFFADCLCKMKLKYPEVFIARIGGEEFAIKIRGTHDFVEDFFSELRKIVFLTDVVPEPITFSVGICPYEKSLFSAKTTVKRIVDAADVALYAAKTAGRNRNAWVTKPALFAEILQGENLNDIARRIGVFCVG